jgi:hypothetical protein
MPRQPIKTHQREVSRFVLQWLVLQALRCVQWDLSLKGLRKRIPVWIHLLDVSGVGISFLPSLKIPPSPFSNLKHLNDGGSSDTAGSLTFRVRWSLRHLETSCCRSKLKFRNESRDVKKVTLFSAALFLAMSSLFLCSCADHPLPPSTPASSRPRIQGEGDIR